MKTPFSKSLWLFGLVAAFTAQCEEKADDVNPFTIAPSVITSNGVPTLSVAFQFPARHHLYAENLSFEVNGAPVTATLPPARSVPDKFSGGQKLSFEQGFQAYCALPNSGAGELTLAVNFQGCNDAECYFPETRRWKIGADYSVTALRDADDGTSVAAAGDKLSAGFQVAGRASGYLSSAKFLGFLDRAEGQSPGADDPAGRFARLGLFATLGLILLGGLALNLTPCVLPMIPINLAILGAGSQNQDRKRGFAMGSAYGAGMALAYGGLGLAVVLTGAKFGTLNSSAWFNFGIALVFAVLGLAMFDKLSIDLSRFQRSGEARSSRGRGAFLAAGTMGAVSASLAGACVAPVVISVLLLATTFYQQGNPLGLLLPFVLGLGMAIPWPFAAAGLSFLPKPGGWMTRVKHGFGVLIFVFAAWYGWLGWGLMPGRVDGSIVAAARGDNVKELRAALEQSRRDGKPVLVDFWASWCKNCAAMEHGTFRDTGVQQRLKDYTLVRFQAERLNDPAVKPILDEFGVMGLPTFVVLQPASATARTTTATN